MCTYTKLLNRNSVLIKSQFLTSIIWRGKRLYAENFFLELLFLLKQNSVFYHFDVFYYSFLNLRPMLTLQLVKVGSTSVGAPSPISERKRRLKAIRFMLLSVKAELGYISLKNLINLIMLIYLGKANLASQRKFDLYAEGINNLFYVYKIK